MVMDLDLNGQLKKMKRKIHDIPIEERPREKAIKYGIESLSNEELLALVFRCGSKTFNVIDLANIVMNEYKTFNNLVNCTYEELIKLNGIKEAKALEILAIMEIAKRVGKNNINNLKVVRHPMDIYEHFSILLKDIKQEVFMVIYLNIKSHIIKYEELFKGGVNSSIVDVNLIFKKAICYDACKIICLHNHPSGDPTPSKQDIMVAKKIDKMGTILEINVMDHIIIGKGRYFSFRENEIEK